MSKNKLGLVEFELPHLDCLSGWLEKAHVKPWYPDAEADLEHARELCELSSTENEDSGQLLITVNRRPIGYLRWQLVSKAVLDSIGLNFVPPNSADVDLLIGEQSEICKGQGRTALAVIEEMMKKRGDVPAIGLTTNKNNRYAHRAFEKSGYTIVGEYSPDSYGDCFLYLKHLH